MKKKPMINTFEHGADAKQLRIHLGNLSSRQMGQLLGVRSHNWNRLEDFPEGPSSRATTLQQKVHMTVLQLLHEHGLLREAQERIEELYKALGLTQS